MKKSLPVFLLFLTAAASAPVHAATSESAHRVLECGTSVPLCAKTSVSRPGAHPNADASENEASHGVGVVPASSNTHGTKVPAESGTKVPHSKTRSDDTSPTALPTAVSAEKERAGRPRSILATPAAASAAHNTGETPVPLHAAAPVAVSTPGEIVAQTLALNPEIRFYENEIASARARGDVAGRWADPELSVEIGRKSSRNADGTFAGDGLAWGVTLAQRFDFSGRNALRKAIAARQIERAEAGLAQFRRELAARAAELSHALLAAQQRLEATEEAAARGRDLLALLVQREPDGVAFLLESRVIEAGIRRLSRDAAVRRAELATALADLNMLRGLPPAAPLRLAQTAAAPAAAPDDTALLVAAFRDNHTLRQFELDLDEQGVALDIERRAAFNDVTLSAYYNEEKAGGKDRFAGVGVSVPLPLWNRNAAGVAEARTRQGQAESALFKLRRDLHKDTLAAAALYRANRAAHLENGAAVLAKFREAAELADRHYRLGAIPAATYLALQQAWLDIVETHTSTRLDALRAAAQLSVLAGIPLEKFFPAANEIPTDAAAKTANANPTR